MNHQRGSQGFGSILVLFGLLAVLVSGVAGVYLNHTIKNRQAASRNKLAEGFYAGEAAAWYNFYREHAGIAPSGLQDSKARYPVNLGVFYADSLPTMPPDPPYDPGSYIPGTPQNLNTTLNLDNGFQTIVRRYKPEDNLRYTSPYMEAANHVAFCGHQYFNSAFDSFRTCLVDNLAAALPPPPPPPPPGPTPGLCDSCTNPSFPCTPLEVPNVKICVGSCANSCQTCPVPNELTCRGPYANITLNCVTDQCTWTGTCPGEGGTINNSNAGQLCLLAAQAAGNVCILATGVGCGAGSLCLKWTMVGGLQVASCVVILD